MFRYFIIFSGAMLLSVLINEQVLAQRVGVSTDVVVLSTLSPNFEIEVNDSQSSSMAFEFSFNPIKFNNGNSFKHISIAPKYKYWLRQIMSSHYIGFEGRYSTFDISLGDKSWHGDMFSVGVNYGYSFVVSNRFNIVPHVGVGYGLECDYSQRKWHGSGVLPEFGVNVQYIISRRWR